MGVQAWLFSCVRVCKNWGAHLHCIQHIILRVVHQLDRAMCPLAQVLDDQVLVDKDIALHRQCT